MSRWSCFGVVILAVGLLAGARPAGAQTVICNTYAPGDTFENGGAAVVGPWLGWNTVAQPFTVPAGSDYQLHSLQIPISHIYGPNTYSLQLTTTAGNVPGAVLETMPFSAVPEANFPSINVTVTSTVKPLLQAGQQYWVVATALDNETSGRWMSRMYGLGVLETDVANRGGGAWSLSHGSPLALKVSATSSDASPAVPEPGSALLFLPALGVMVFIRRRRWA